MTNSERKNLINKTIRLWELSVDYYEERQKKYENEHDTENALLNYMYAKIYKLHIEELKDLRKELTK